MSDFTLSVLDQSSVAAGRTAGEAIRETIALAQHCDALGFNRYWCRPDWMICTVLPIPPPQVRPSVIQDNNQRSEDDLTHKLSEIITTNRRLQETISNNEKKSMITDEHTVLQYHVATLVDTRFLAWRPQPSAQAAL
jgi:DNA-directed RNA polymerase beta' subunit